MKKGFTLLEMLLVIAAIGVLAAIVIVAINPNRQLSQARDAERRAETNSVYKATEQYLIDTGEYPTGLTNSYQEICAEGALDCTGLIDLSMLTPTYIAAIPSDPQASGNGSGYEIAINSSNNKITIRATNTENGDPIVINVSSDFKEVALDMNPIMYWDYDNITNQAILPDIVGDGDWEVPLSGQTQLNYNQPPLVSGSGNSLELNYNSYSFANHTQQASSTDINSMTNDFTIVTFVSIPQAAITSNTNINLFYRRDINTGIQAIALYANLSNELGQPNSIYAVTDNNGNARGRIYSGSIPWIADQPYMITYTSSSIAGEGKRIFLNDQQVAHESNNTWGANPITSGRVTYGPGSATPGYRVDDMMIFNRILSPAEISELYIASGI